ncbi:hypothetical protein Asppvi_003582 [Aspergillus pseudoviridinutans]|uniref:Myb-like DNA-binding domain-containing protein n=1 Tax=Aspergillus pseudoviridinutans TaxID=1517512 RepID=A0A9P3EQZ1_9EURO|nr:uncharacterized protein Asppvi_003582 [Aspergillus pseudoviridinutans]GIJ84731.1 hypothetical protein Asppvi_003582 [Aspergillus pseudoviridinutans]
MTPTNPDETVQFLLSCIRYSNSGKVDFSEVAKECNIVSKGAAAKRYERLIKAYNEVANGTTTSTTTTTGSEADAAIGSLDSTPKKTKPAKAGPLKKTKAKQAGECESSSSPAKRKPAGEGSKTGTKKVRVTKETVVVSAERLVEQRLSPVKEEEVSDAEEQGYATAVDSETLFDQF